MTDQQPPQLAAIDLGSNSFHLTIAREVQGELQMVDRIGEKVQLAAGLDSGRMLSEEAIERGLACLERFAQRLAGIPDNCIRVVGTNTLRAARNRRQFIQRAEKLLGCPVEVIAGREEARLIYLGVAHSFSDDEEQRLVVDIGGGSTEFIIGRKFAPVRLESLHMGCVSFTRRFFGDGRTDRLSFQRAINAAHLELLNIRQQYRQTGWQDVVGSSGTIKATYQLLNAEQQRQQPITLKSLRDLRDQLIDFETLEQIQLPGIKENRATVMPGGIAILIAVFEALSVDSMDFSVGALREGLLYDHIGRQHHEDVRERTINALLERYHIDRVQALAVEQTALDTLTRIGPDTPTDRELLSRACRLHEIGLAISHSQFQKHGAYLIENSDLPGFGQHEQSLLAVLVRGHRRKLPKQELDKLSPDSRQRLVRLMQLLRLAVLLHHSRQPEQLPAFTLQAENPEQMSIEFPGGWLDAQPLTRADLQQEAEYLATAGITLDYS